MICFAGLTAQTPLYTWIFKTNNCGANNLKTNVGLPGTLVQTMQIKSKTPCEPAKYAVFILIKEGLMKKGPCKAEQKFKEGSEFISDLTAGKSLGLCKRSLTTLRSGKLSLALDC